MKPDDLLVCEDHTWRVRGVHLGGEGVESLIEIENVSHQPGWTGWWETHQMMFVPEILLRQCADDRPQDRPDTDNIRWAVNVLLETIAAKFEANPTWDIWRSDAAALVRSFKHATPVTTGERVPASEGSK